MDLRTLTTDGLALAPGNLANAMTIDVEEYFQVSAFDDVVERTAWERIPSRVSDSIDRLLDLLDETGVRATFFVLGWLAERKPDVVRTIAARGHEIGCHGWAHELIYRQTPERFRDETRRARAVLQDLAGQPVRGYRAASFSIGRGNLWALDVLAEAGFTYDSSLFPIRHDRYGIVGAPRRIHRLTTPSGHDLIEVPPSTVLLGGVVVPVAGGGYLRMFPRLFTRWAVGRLNRHELMPAVIYIHPWEIDPDQPRIRARLLSRVRHYSRLRSTEDKLRDLLRRYPFAAVEDVLGLGRPVPAPVEVV